MFLPPRLGFTLLGMAAILIWSTTVAFVRSLAEQVGSLTSAAIIYSGGGLVGSAWLLGHPDRARRVLSLRPAYLFGCGSLFVLYMASLYLAFEFAASRTRAVEVGLVNYLWPMATLFFSVQLLRLPARQWLLAAGCGLAVLGIVLAVTQDSPSTFDVFFANWARSATSYGLALLAALAWGVYSALSRRFLPQGGSTAVPLFMLATGMILGLAAWVFPEPCTWSGRAVGELLYMAVFTNLAYVFWELAMRRGDIVLVAATSYLIPFFATVVGCLYLDVKGSPKLWTAVACLVGGAVLSKLAVRSRQPLP